jgi:hypothetical protein
MPRRSYRPRTLSAQLLAGLIFLGLTPAILLGARAQMLTKAPVPRRLRRLVASPSLQTSSKVGCRVVQAGNADPRAHHTTPNDWFAAAQAPIPPRCEGWLQSGTSYSAPALVFPPRYLLFCSFLC